MVSLQQGALQIFCGALGTLGFALFFFVRPKHLLLVTLGGALSWLIYLLVLHGGGGVFLVRGPGPRAKGSGPHLPTPRHRTPAPRRGAVLFDERLDPRRYGHVFSKGEGSGAGGPGYRGRYFDRVRGRPSAHVEQPTQETSPVPQNTPASEENGSKLTL